MVAKKYFVTMNSNKSNSLIITLLILILVAVIGVIFLKFRSTDSDVTSLASFESKVEAFLMNNPKVVVNALEKHYRKAKEDELSKRQDTLKSRQKDLQSNAPFIGDANSDIVVVEFFDYNCGYCKKALETITELVDNDPNVKVVLKDFPILGPQSMLLAQASIAAYEIDPDKYFKTHQELMNIGRSASREKVITKLSELGYDSVELSKKMDSKSVKKTLQDNRKLAQELGIGGTPAFILNDQFIDGFVDYKRLSQMISEVR
jgi:protein-disulfide isomerase